MAIREFSNIMIDLGKKPSADSRYKKTFFLAGYLDNKLLDPIIQAQILSNKKSCENVIKQLKKKACNLQRERMYLTNK